MSENIEIKVTDGVEASVVSKIQAIGREAKTSHTSVEKLQKALAAIGGGSLQKLQTELNKTSLSHQKLQTEIARTQVQQANLEAAMQRGVAAEARASIALNKLSEASTKNQIATERLNQAKYKSAEATSKAEQAALRAQAASVNLASVEAKLNTALNQAATSSINKDAALNRLTSTQNNAAASAQRLVTAQNIAAASANTQAASAERLHAATLRTSAAQQALQTAQNRAAASANSVVTSQNRVTQSLNNAQAAAARLQSAQLRLQQQQARLNTTQGRSLSTIAAYTRQILSLVATGFGLREILRAADAYTTLQNKLQNVTTSQRQVGALTEEMFELANRTRTGVESTTTAFMRFDRALKTMGKSQSETLRMTETVNKALITSGATTQEAQSALLQLSQAFNAGRLMGDEFRAVSENMPIVLDAVAKALDVPINKVKKLSSEGKITSEVMFNAFKIMEKQVDETFGKTTATLGQGLTVLRNDFIKFVGELDKSLGVTSSIAQAMMWLGKNLDIVAAVAAVAGATLLVAFSGSILGAIGAATKAVVGFTVALASNPIGLLVIGLTAATAYITLFGDKVMLGSNKLYSLKDAAIATFQLIYEYVSSTSRAIYEALLPALQAIGVVTADSGKVASDSIGTIWDVTKSVGNFIIGVFNLVGKTLAATFAYLPYTIKGFYNNIANLTASAVELVVNSWQIGLRKIANVVSTLMPDVAKSMNAGLDAMTLKLPRLDTSGAELAANEMKEIWKESFSTDFIGNFGKDVEKRATELANARRALIDDTSNNQLRGPGVNTLPDDDDKGAKGAEKRAAALAKINTQLENEIDRMFVLQPLREEQARFDQIEEQLIGKKIRLTKSESEAIREKIRTIMEAKDVQTQYDAIYERYTEPKRVYNATIEAAGKLLQQGAISQERFAGEVTKAAIAYASASDPLYEFNKNLDEQMELLKYLPKQREIESQILSKVNEAVANGNLLSDEEIKLMREKLTLQQNLNAVAEHESSLLSSSVDKRRAFNDQLQATVNLLRDMESGFTKSDALTALSSSEAGQLLANSPEMMAAQIAQMQVLYGQIDAMRQADLISEQTASAAKMQIWQSQQNLQLNQAKTFFGNLAGLQNSSNKKLAAIGKAAAISNAMINTYQSATAAYAAMAPIPYVGPALGAAAAAAAIAAGLANVAQIRSQGFREGGYTGNGGLNDIAGVVHGQEFVMNAEATSRIGASNLQALQDGKMTLQRYDGENSGKGSPTVVVQFDIVNSISVENSGPSSDAQELEKAGEAISRKTQTDIMDSIRNNNVWAKIIKQAATQ